MVHWVRVTNHEMRFAQLCLIGFPAADDHGQRKVVPFVPSYAECWAMASAGSRSGNLVVAGAGA